MKLTRLALVCFSVFFITSVTGCSPQNNNNKDNCVKIITEKMSYEISAQSVPYSLCNNTDKPIYFGEDETLEHFDNGKWSYVQLKENIAFPSVLIRLGVGQKKTYSLCLSNFDFQFVKGKYRINKEYSFDNSGLKDKIKVSGEFNLE